MIRPIAVLIALHTVHAQDVIRFEDVTARSGLRFALQNGAQGKFHLVELMTGGVAAFDADNDGCIDLFFANGAELPGFAKILPSYQNRLFRNNCKWRFTDITAESGLGGEGYSMGAAAGDYDSDGDTDLVVTGVRQFSLYQNDGKGHFTDVTNRAGLASADPRWSVSAGFFDFDNYGRLDLFVSNYVEWQADREPSCGPPGFRLYCHPNSYRAVPNQLFRNRGQGKFEDVSGAVGLAGLRGKAMGVAFADYDGDGWTDVFVANDSMPNFLLRNVSGKTFEEVGLQAGVAYADHGNPVASMGTHFADIDNDGVPDLGLTAMVGDSYLLFRNTGGPLRFSDITVRAGLFSATGHLTGWGMGFVDFDNDGWRDAFYANSHFPQLGRHLGTSSELACIVLRNQRGARFVMQNSSGLSSKALFRGAAFADFDNDGRIDVAVSAIGSGARIYRNVTSEAGNWISIRGIRVGARVEVELPDGSKQFATVTASVGYASSSEGPIHFGIGAHKSVSRVLIQTPTGKRRIYTDVPAGSVLTAAGLR